MKTRLSFEERNEIAFKLRSQIIGAHDPEKLEILSDPQFLPHQSVVGSYAFEFFLDMFRQFGMSQEMEDAMDYHVGWSKGAIERDEETRRPMRIFRMATELFMAKYFSDDVMKEVDIRARELLKEKGVAVMPFDLKSFFYEVAYELLFERMAEKYGK